MTSPEQSERDNLHQTLLRFYHISMHKVMRSSFRFQRKENLSFTQLAALHLIDKKDLNKASLLSEALDISNAATSQLLGRLVNRELLLCRIDEHDRRNRQFSLAPAGKDLLERHYDARLGWINDFSTEFSREETIEMNHTLKKLIAKMEGAQDVFPKKHQEDNQ